MDPQDPLEHKDLQVLRAPQDPPVPAAQTAPPDSVLIKYGWPKAIRARRQTSLHRSQPEGPQGQQGRLGPQGRQELPVRKAPQGRPDHKDLLEPKVLWVLPVRKDPLGPKGLLEPKVLRVLPEQPVRKAPQGRQGQQEPTVRTANPCSTVPSILQLARVRLATSI